MSSAIRTIVFDTCGDKEQSTIHEGSPGNHGCHEYFVPWCID